MHWSPIHIERWHTVALSRADVWRLVSETNHLNRVIGLFPVKFGHVRRDAHGPFREASAKVARLIPMKWREYPFQWVVNRAHMVERVYESGPLLRFIAGLELLDEGSTPDDDVNDGQGNLTKIKFYADVTPRNWLGFIAIHLVGAVSMRRTISYLDGYFSALGNAPRAHRPQSRKNYAVQTEELERLLSVLAGLPIDKSYIPILRNLVLHHDDDEVASVRPYELAEQNQVNERELLRLFLYATKVGIFNLSWSLMCPNCRVSKLETPSLFGVESSFHCDFCGVEYETQFDKYVELRFAVHPNVRTASQDIFCVGGPGLSSHILIQQCIAAGQQTTIRYPRSNEATRIRVLQSNHVTRTISPRADGAESVAITFTEAGWIDENLDRLQPNSNLQIDNHCAQTIVVALERVQWDERAVTAAEVTSMQEFRDLFSSEVLAPGQQVGIENVTIFFSDLRGSTALYEQIGDAHAYGYVRKHFDFLQASIANHSGTVVKTIGDAVMAVFHRPGDAVGAALDIQQHSEAFSRSVGEKIAIKIGIHTGAAIAVNSNDTLDYFGRTVNIAARIQGCSNGGDIVVSGDVLAFSDVRAYLQQDSIQATGFRAMLKGIDEEFDLHRWVVVGSESKLAAASLSPLF